MLNVSVFGEGNPETIVFLHGGGTSGWSWRWQVEALEGAFHCLVPDLPGHGSSDGVFSIAQAALEVRQLIQDRAHDAQAHVVGLSLGAQTATQLLALDPSVLRSAVLSGTSVRPAPGSGFLSAAVLRPLTVATLVAYMPVRNARWLVRANMRSLGVPPEFEAEFAEDTRRLTLEGFVRVMDENLRFRIPDDLERAQVRVLIIVGERELRVMRESAHDLVRALPNSRGVMARGLGHNWSLEQPELFTQTVLAWVRGEPLPAGLKPF